MEFIILSVSFGVQDGTHVTVVLGDSSNILHYIIIPMPYTVKTLYNVTRYNRIFNIRGKFAGNGSVSIKIPSFYQNIHLTTQTVSSGNRYTFSIGNEFIITKFLSCVCQFFYQHIFFATNNSNFITLNLKRLICALMQDLLHEQVSVKL